MNRIILTIGCLFCFSLRLLAHGVEALAIGFPAIIYFLILPILISRWDYEQLMKHIPITEFSKRGLWIQNYFTGIGTYFLSFFVSEEFGIVSDTTYFLLLVVPLLLIQTFGKSFLYHIFNASKKVAFLEILESIYKLNIAIISASVGLGLILFYLIKLANM